MPRLVQRRVQIVVIAALIALVAIVAVTDHPADAGSARYFERLNEGREAGLASGATLGIGAPSTLSTLTPPAETPECSLTNDGQSPQAAACLDRWIDFPDHYQVDVRGGARYVLWFDFAADCDGSLPCEFMTATPLRPDHADATQPANSWYVYPGGASTTGAVDGVPRTYLASPAKLEAGGL